ncbi:hypothetical protein LSCM1_03402 [Leishmania martiniquensis]|uniref:Uncharacterized protein n=1 Tax=Leishmania martiniquensis TaxID=1580590 RepID=A0A836GK83_9TRYP|nr:hypothetical protein LSCM1_03402 [Leishmania martiniquensis]
MPLEDTDATKPLPSPLSDSVVLESVCRPTQALSAVWLDALQAERAPPLPSQATLPGYGAVTAAASQPLSSTAKRQHTQSSTHSERTPTASRHRTEMTVIESPIPVVSDNSNAHLEKLLSRVGELARSEHYAASPGVVHGLDKPPAPTAAQAQRKAFRSSSAAVPRSTSGSSPAEAPPHAMRAPPTCASPQRFPFGESRATTTTAEISTSQWRSDDNTHTFDGGSLSCHEPQLPSTYSSALMQALSRTEGAVALTSQRTSTAQHGSSYANYSDSEAGKGSSSNSPSDMYEEAMRAKVAKQHWAALEKARQEVLEEARRRRDCPFAPQVSPYAARIQRPASLRPENRFGAEVIRRKQWVAKRRQEEVERELQSCTFRPLTLRTARLDPSAMESSRTVTNVFRDLYAEAGRRRAFERDVKPQLLHQLEECRHPSSAPMGPDQVAEIVERLCTRGVVHGAAGSAPPKGNAELFPYESDVRSVHRASSRSDAHHPTLSLETQRIVAAQIVSGERDGDIVKQLYRHAAQDAARGHLKRELDREQERLARVEQAVALAQERKHLQQEYHRAVLVAKFRSLAQHVACARRCSYRTTASQSVVQLARAALDVLSADEAEEVLGAVEHCGRSRLTEGEFAVVVFRYLAEKQATPEQSALLRKAPPPPPSTRRAASAATPNRADKDRGIGGSVGSSPAGLPRVKREKPEPGVVEQVRARRARELAEWREENLRQRPVCDGVLVEGGEYTFHPAPRRLIPYECRPDVVVPIKSTRSTVLRHDCVSARIRGEDPSPAVDTLARYRSPQACPATRATSRKLFTPVASNQASAWTHECSRSAAAGVESSAPQEGSGAALSFATNGAVAAVPASCQHPSAEPAGALSTGANTEEAAAILHPQRSSEAAPHGGSSAPASPHLVPTGSHHKSQPAARHHRESTCHSRGTVLPVAPSLVQQIMHSTPEERARLGRELLLRQIREHQRRSGA